MRETIGACAIPARPSDFRADAWDGKELKPFLPPTIRPWTKGLTRADPQGPLYHTLRVFLIDRESRIRNIYSSVTLDPRLVLTDVKTLLLEESRLSKQ